MRSGPLGAYFEIDSIQNKISVAAVKNIIENSQESLYTIQEVVGAQESGALMVYLN